MRIHCESEVLDWVRNHADPFSRRRDIRKAYLALKAAGVFNDCGRRRGRYALALWWWEKVGQVWPIKFVFIVENVVREFRILA